jgi:hypothetical protein
MGIKIRWVKARVGRLIGDVETVGNVEMGKKWIEYGYAERADGAKAPAKTPRPVVETADVVKAPVDKVIRAPGERKIADDPLPSKQPRRRPRNVADDD